MLGALTRLGIRRGLLGGSRAWMAVGVAAVAVRLLRRMASRGPEVVYCEPLDPGQRLLISHAGKALADLGG